jgi:hypothetical protein
MGPELGSHHRSGACDIVSEVQRDGYLGGVGQQPLSHAVCSLQVAAGIGAGTDHVRTAAGSNAAFSAMMACITHAGEPQRKRVDI